MLTPLPFALSIKAATFLRAFKTFGKLQTYVIEEIIFKSAKVQKKQREHWNYSTERVDRRLKREPEHPDLWSKVRSVKFGMRWW